MDPNLNFIRLPLKNADNVRDLGGLPAAGGRVTRWKVFLRGDGLYSLDGPDADMLISYGVRTNIDLRTASEREEYPSVLARSDKIKYYGAQLFGDVGLNNYAQMNFNDLSLGKIYEKNLKNCAENIKNVFEIIGSEIVNGAILYNCTAGKDRTGIITALLLDLAGVSPCDIAANYEVTHTLITRQIELVKQIEPDLPPEVFGSSPDNMIFFTDRLREIYGGARGYLQNAGVNEGVLESIAERFTQEY